MEVRHPVQEKQPRFNLQKFAQSIITPEGFTLEGVSMADSNNPNAVRLRLSTALMEDGEDLIDVHLVWIDTQRKREDSNGIRDNNTSSTATDSLRSIVSGRGSESSPAQGTTRKPAVLRTAGSFFSYVYPPTPLLHRLQSPAQQGYHAPQSAPAQSRQRPPYLRLRDRRQGALSSVAAYRNQGRHCQQD